MTLEEVDLGDGNVEVRMGAEKLTCVVCRCQVFHERNSLLNTRAATFFNFDWANKEATNYICTRCGYIFWFMQGER